MTLSQARRTRRMPGSTGGYGTITSTQAHSGSPQLRIEGGTGYVSGRWTLTTLHEVEPRLSRLRWPAAGSLRLDLAGVTELDTAGAVRLRNLADGLRHADRTIAVTGLSGEAAVLMDLVSEATASLPVRLPRPARQGSLQTLGRTAVDHARQALDLLAFLGEVAVAALGWLVRPWRVRWRFFLRQVETAGFDALPIVGLLSFLIGVVIAYQGAVLLRQYGADLYIADLVGLAMVRELAPLITAILVAGRTGSSYTAELGTMQVTEEVDALRTMGVSPVELLVLPRLLGLLIVLPLLTVYADVLGILGGYLMATAVLDVNLQAFIDRLAIAVTLPSYLIGVGKAPVFALVIATVGCHHGLQARGSAADVGRRVTTSVVQAIFLVIVVDAGFSVLFSWLGI